MTDTKGNDEQVGNSPGKADDKSAENNGGVRETAASNTASTRSSASAKSDDVQSARTSAATDKQVSKQPEKQANKESAASTGNQQPKRSQHKQTARNGQSGNQQPAAPDKPGSGSGGGRNDKGGTNSTITLVVAVVALVIAIIAIAGAAWTWHRSESHVADVDARIDNIQAGLQASVQGWVSPKLDSLRSHMNDVAKSNKSQAKQLKKLDSQLQQTRLQLSDLVQRMQGGAFRWQLQQIEHLLIVANRRLQLYRSPEQASSALQLASRMVGRINDPRLFKVRKRIVDGIAALDALPSPDVEGMALKLSAFVDQVPDLPLVSDVPKEYKTKNNAGKATQGDGASGLFGINWSSGWQRFESSVGHALKSMVTIRRSNGTQVALLPPDQVYFLNQNLILQLRSARLALMQGNGALYRQSLDTAIDWLKKYFDTDDSAVSAMVKRLGQMQNVKLDWQAPDISGSLHALRAYMKAHDHGSSGAHTSSHGDSGASNDGGSADSASKSANTEQGDD